MNKLHFGDNLNILRGMDPEIVDLVYLDPPFNSKANYNILFKSTNGEDCNAQITAFDDSWHWGPQAQKEFNELLKHPNAAVSEMFVAFQSFLGKSDMMAYLVMMASRLVELKRVLKSTGSLYLHCDPSSSHYLKLVLDVVFGKENFRNEIVWKRTSGHNGAKRWGPIHDSLLFYTKSNKYCWNKQYEPYSDNYLSDFYKYEDAQGQFRLGDLTGAGIRSGSSGKSWRGVDPTPKGRHWAVPIEVLQPAYPELNLDNLNTQEKLDLLDKAQLVYWPPKGSVPQLKRYLDPNKGLPIQDVIIDIQPLGTHAAERLGYPTQKPQELLERIINASSNQGDLVLDPFCGCGTAIHAAHKLDRKWIGIDITHLAIALIEKRVKEAFPDIIYEVEGTPKNLAGATDLAMRDKYQFQWWACSLVSAQPYQDKKKGADGGIDGLIYFDDSNIKHQKIGKVIVSIKGGGNVSLTMLKDLIATVHSNKADIGLFITLTKPTKPMVVEALSAGCYISGNGREYSKIQILTIEDILSGKLPQYPDISGNQLTFKPTRRTQNKTDGKQTKLFLGVPDPKKPKNVAAQKAASKTRK